MAIRRVRASWVLSVCLVLGSSELAWGQSNSYDRMHLAQSDAPGLLSYQGTRSHDASREALQNLPADYFNANAQAAPEPSQSASAVREAAQSRRLGNLLILSCLALSFGLGLIITLTTIRRQSAGAAPRPLF